MSREDGLNTFLQIKSLNEMNLKLNKIKRTAGIARKFVWGVVKKNKSHVHKQKSEVRACSNCNSATA